jgi:signal transduction histidine kinase
MPLGAKLGQDRSLWVLALFVLVGVLLPTGCVLWFMNVAVRSQAESARRSVAEAYHGQLRMVRDSVGAFWRARAAAILHPSGDWKPSDFSRVLAASRADSVILLDKTGAAVHRLAAPGSDPTLGLTAWNHPLSLERSRQFAAAATEYSRLAGTSRDPLLVALAAQAQVRCLAQNGQREAAIAVIQRRFSSPSPEFDLLGGYIAANEHLFALQLLKPSDARFAATAELLAAWLNDYSVPIPTAQRLFLMTELSALAPGRAALPTFAAERMAADFEAEEPARVDREGLQACQMRGLWKFPLANGRAIALYRGESVVRGVEGVWAKENHGRVRFGVTGPDQPEQGKPAQLWFDAIPAGPMMPGWEISLALENARDFDLAARNQQALYIWAGYLAVAAIALAGILACASLRRQARLARLRTDLVAAVSHELKTPLASMRLLVETLIEDGFEDQKAAHEYLNMIAGENLRLSRLIDNFLEFSRMERKRQNFQFADTRAEEVIQSAMLAVRERSRHPETHLEVDVSEGLPSLWADHDAMVTVLLNLLDNAYKYSGPEKWISLRVFRENGTVIFSVKDNGIGIARRDQKRIFRSFYRVDQRLARETGGCGLGLSIVDFIVRAHGGRVEVESQPGAGSTFRVAIPYEN